MNSSGNRSLSLWPNLDSVVKVEFVILSESLTHGLGGKVIGTNKKEVEREIIL